MRLDDEYKYNIITGSQIKCMVIPYGVRLAEGVLDGEAGELVDESEGRHALGVLHPGAEAHVLVPVLQAHTQTTDR
jgi:hypothetical protein